jgi:hypothetical protein
MIRRLDHIILCVRDRHAWAERISRVLALESERSRDDDPWGFANFEFNIGDGFLGIVSPSSPDSQLERFLARHDDAYYAVSVDTGTLEAAKAQFEAAATPTHMAIRDGVAHLAWPSPSATAGVLFQVFGGLEPVQGSNPSLGGLRRAVLAAEDLERSVEQLCTAFGLESPALDDDDDLDANVATFDLTGSPLGHQLVVAAARGQGSLADHVARHGSSIYEWGLFANDLDAEMQRLDSIDVSYECDSVGAERRILIDSAEVGGLRLRLHGR